MEGRLLLRDCALCGPDRLIRSGLSVLVEENRVRSVAPSKQLPTLPGDWEVPCRGRLVTAGLIDCRADLVGRQLAPRGRHLRPGEGGRRRRALEAALDPGEVEVLSALAVARSLRSGITFLIEQLRSPGDVEGALRREAKAIRALGARAIVAHANGGEDSGASGLQQLAANARFAEEARGDELVRAGLGFASVARSDDALLAALAQSSRELGATIHGHLDWSTEAAARLQSLGLFDRRCVLAAESEEELRALLEVEAPGLLRVVVPPLDRLRWRLEGLGERVCKQAVALGSGDRALWEAWQWLSPQIGGQALERVAVETPSRFCSEVFGACAGDIRDGALADLVVWEQIPAEEHVPAGLAGYLLEQGDCFSAAWTVVNGRVVVREGQLLGHDYTSLAQEAATALRRLRRRAGLSSE